MNDISTTDRIFATVTSYGRTVLKSTYSGMASLEDVVCAVNRAIGGTAAGMLTLMIRNGSQGWAMKRALRLAAPRRIADGVQLTLF